jgi:hypothetical protein
LAHFGEAKLDVVPRRVQDGKAAREDGGEVRRIEQDECAGDLREWQIARMRTIG